METRKQICSICGQPIRQWRAMYGTRTQPMTEPKWQHVPAVTKAKRAEAATHEATQEGQKERALTMQELIDQAHGGNAPGTRDTDLPQPTQEGR